jgi:phosphonatase-like hydrolase
MHIELVIFGLVGTTVADDGLVGGPLRAALARVAAAPDDDALTAVEGYGASHAIRLLLARGGRQASERSAADVQRVHDDLVGRIVTRASDAEPVRETAGASQAFWQLKQRGVKVATVTGLSMMAADAIHDRLGWRARGLVDVGITSDDVERGAPYPDAIYEVMQRAGIRESARVMVVASAVAELQQASSAGCGLVVGVFGEGDAFERLRVAPHNVLLPTCALVPELLQRIDARRIAPAGIERSA